MKYYYTTINEKLAKQTDPFLEYIGCAAKLDMTCIYQL